MLSIIENKNACVAQYMTEHINIMLKSTRGNSINMWNLGLQVGHEMRPASRASLLIDDNMSLSIDV